MPKPPQKDQLLLPIFGLPTVVPQGDGSMVVRPGKPVLWLTPAQFAAQVGLSADTVRRYIHSGTVIPSHLVECIGLRKYRISSEAVGHFLEHCRRLRDG